MVTGETTTLTLAIFEDAIEVLQFMKTDRLINELVPEGKIIIVHVPLRLMTVRLNL